MWSDTESRVDYLNYSEIAELIAEMISDGAMLPLSVGIYGTWGMGKSSALCLIEDNLAQDPTNLVVMFDAWLYQDFEEAKAALMSVIAKAVYDEAPEGLKEKAADLYRRTNKLKALGLMVDLGAAAVGIPTMGVFSKAGGALQSLVSGDGDTEDVTAIKDAATTGSERLSGLLAPKERRNAPEEITEYRKEFGHLLETMKRRLVVFVDNLDRCLPENTIATLEAMRLFLFLPKTAFVVAADEEMIRHAVARQFANPGDRHVSDYLDKLIQVPVRLPKLGLQEVRAYLFMLSAERNKADGASREKLRVFLIEKLQKSWSEDGAFAVDDVLAQLAFEKTENSSAAATDLETMDRLAPMLAFSSRINGNPRIVKRMLNVVRMRSRVAKLRGMTLGEPLISKLALFERCTNDAAVQHLYSLVSEAQNGKPSVLSALEAAKPEEIGKLLPEQWSDHTGFIGEWVKLPPSLGGVDLRPAIYLARETLPLRFVSSRMSIRTRKAIETLMKTQSLSSKASAVAIQEIEPSEVGDAMDEVIAAMGRNADWSRARDDFKGAILMARKWPVAHEKLVRFVAGMTTAPRWITALMKAEN